MDDAAEELEFIVHACREALVGTQPALAPVAFKVRLKALGCTLSFEARPADQGAPEKTMAVMLRSNAAGYEKAGTARFTDGRWFKGTTRKPMNAEGLYWLRLAHEQA